MKRLAKRTIILVFTIMAVLIAAAPAFAETEPLEDYLLRKMQDRETEIDVSEYHIPAEDRKTVFTAYDVLLETHPEYEADLYVSFRESDGVKEVSKVIIKTAEKYPDSYKYPYGYRFSDQEIQEFHNKVDGILDQVETGWTDFQKILFIHDYLITIVTYRIDEPNGSAIKTIMDGEAVCEGYTKAFKYLMFKLNVPCECVISEKECHAWNAVMVNGDYYYVDTTWDDDNDPLCPDSMTHFYFLLTKKEMRGVHEENDWKLTDGRNAFTALPDGPARSSQFEFLQEIPWFIRQKGHKLYYYEDLTSVNGRANGYEYDLDTKEKTTLFSYTNVIKRNYSKSGVIIPDLKVKLKDGTSLVKDVDYTATLNGEADKVGRHVITLKVNQYDVLSCPVFLLLDPPKTSIVKITPKKGALVVKWKKMTDEVTGYRIKYSTRSSMSGAKTIKITSKDKTSYKIKKLKRKKKYFVTIYTYLRRDGETYTSGSCKKKAAKTK